MAGQDLNWKNITFASRITLPAYCVLTLWYGLNYIFMSPSHTSYPALDPLRTLMPFRMWGVVFVVIGAIETTALICRKRNWMMLGLCLGIGLWSMWAAGYALGMFDFHTGTVLLKSNVSLNTPLPSAFIVVCHVASLTSLARDLGAQEIANTLRWYDDDVYRNSQHTHEDKSGDGVWDPAVHTHHTIALDKSKIDAAE